MTMTPYSTDIKRPLKWEHNKAARLTSVVDQKSLWYDRYCAQFWTYWIQNVFDLRTANPFGLTVWSIILGMPQSLFALADEPNAWAYGKQRQNYKDLFGAQAPLNFTAGPDFYANGTKLTSGYTFSGATGEVTFTAAPAAGVILTWTGSLTSSVTGQEVHTATPFQFATGDGTTKVFFLLPSTRHPNETGGNFYGGSTKTVSILEEARQLLQLRYVALISNGNLEWINEMLAMIFNKGEPWDFPSKRYFYVADCTLADSINGAAIAQPMYMEYRIGAGLPLSAQFVTILNTHEYGIMPTVGGVKYAVIQET